MYVYIYIYICIYIYIYVYIYIGRWEIVSALFVLVFREGETRKNLSPPQGLEN